MKKVFVVLTLLISKIFAVAQESILVKFKVDVSSQVNITNFGVRGNASPLSWEKTVFLKDMDKDGIYEGEMLFPRHLEVLEYKYVYGDKNLVWELDLQNRILILEGEQIQTNDAWNIQNTFDVKKLPKLSPGKLTEDFLILKKAIVEIHPGLNRYHTRSETDSIFNYFQQEFSKPMTYQEAFLNFTRFTSSIQCGHTYPNFYNQTGFIKEVVLDQRDKLPFAFRVLNERIFITDNNGVQPRHMFGYLAQPESTIAMSCPVACNHKLPLQCRAETSLEWSH
jgi:hypothetical protein